MRQYILLFFLLFPICLTTKAQLGNFPVGGRAMALGNATTTLQDGWAIYNNVAGIAQSEQMSAGVSYHYPYSLAPLSTAGAYFVSPLRFGSVGLSVLQFGDKLFNEQRITLGYAHRIANVDLGLEVNYHQIQAQGLGSKGVPSIGFGVITQLTESIYLGAKATNITQTQLVEFEDERLPSTIKIGISYRPTEKLMVNIETAKDVDFDPVFLGGVEYEIVPALTIRTGFTSEPNAIYGGLGFKVKKFMIDYAINNHETLGISQQLSIAVNLKEISSKKTDK